MLKGLNLNLIKRMSFIFVFFVMFFGVGNASGSSGESSSGIQIVCSINQNDELGCWAGSSSLEQFPPGFNSNVKEVSVWDGFACVVKNDNSLYCDDIGPRGGNGRLSFDIPDYWKKNVKSVSVGHYLFCIVNLNDELGCFSGGVSTIIPQGFETNIQSVVAGVIDTCVIDLNNKLTCWDSNGDFFNIPKNWEKVKSVDTKNSYFCTVNVYDDAFCWHRSNNARQKYNVTNKKLNSISVGRSQNVCGIMTNGNLDCNFPHTLPAENIKSVNLGMPNTLCVVNNDNELICESGYEPPENWKKVKISSYADLSIDSNNVYTENNIFKFEVNSENIGENIFFNIKRQNVKGIIIDEKHIGRNIKFGINEINITEFKNLEVGEFFHVQINPTGDVFEKDYNNNYLLLPVTYDNLNLYVDVDFGDNYPELNKVVYDYLDSNFNLVSNRLDANYNLVVGDNAITKKNLMKESENLKIINEDYTEPYTSSVLFKNSLILIASNGIPGSVAGVKRLVNKKMDWMFANNPKLDIIDNYDKLGLSVVDFLNNDRLGQNFLNNDELLASQVKNILYGNNIDVSVKTVKTNSADTSYEQEVQLRLKNLNIDYSKGFVDAFELNKSPVVMSGGLFSNIDTFEDFGRELVQDGQNVWLMEMTGGPDIESETSPDYTYGDLVNSHWPASIAAVQYYSEKPQINYVGHSNGCRAALSSLNEYSKDGKNNAGKVLIDGAWESVDMSELPVDKFFGIACPSTLNNDTDFTRGSRSSPVHPYYINNVENLNAGDYAINFINNTRNLTHLEISDYANILGLGGSGWVKIFLGFGHDKISLNLMNFYNNLATNPNTMIDFSNVEVNKIRLYNGFPNDRILNYQDGLDLYDSLSHIENRAIFGYENGYTNHMSMKNRDDVNENIIWSLN